MNDDNLADQVREIAEKMHRHANHNNVRGTEEEYVRLFADQLMALLPPRPTLADMTPEERAECQWMQASFTKSHHEHIITQVFGEKARLLRRVDGAMFEVHHDEVVPYPDLPRLTWPGDTPAPSLPDGWRLADHPQRGRVIVTSTEPDTDGHVYFVAPADGPIGNDWHLCNRDVLTYLDQ